MAGRMDITKMCHGIADWMDGSGPLADIVISSRIRLARNVAGYLFFSHADEEQQAELLEYVRGNIMATELKDDMSFLEMRETPVLQHRILSERHLISRRLAESQGICGVALANNESLTIMINEEDHLRLQALAAVCNCERHTTI